MKYTKEEISLEYDISSKAHQEFEKVKWGSEKSMTNRFLLAMECIDFKKIQTWLDIGSGTGQFQSLVLKKYPQISSIGIDISSKLIEFAQHRQDALRSDFRKIDFMELTEGEFDLISSIGVLQKTTMTLTDFFAHATTLLKSGGQLFVDTKHSGWKRFLEPGFEPEPSHLWFSLEELCSSISAAGLILKEMQGFIPNENKIVSPEESHTIFCIAYKK